MEKIFLKRKYSISFLLGIFNSLPFLVDKLFFVSWFSFAPFLIIISNYNDDFNSKKEFFRSIFAFFFSYYLGAYHFFLALYPMSFVGIDKLPSLIIIFLAWGFLSFFHSIIISVLSCFTLLKIDNKIRRIFFQALLFVIFEYFLSIGALAFPWARFSLLQYKLPALIQSASVFGPYFIDLLMLLCNAFVACIFVTKNKKFYIVAFSFIFLLNCFFGLFCLNNEYQKKGKSEVALIQGNVLSDNKWDGVSSYRVYKNETSKLNTNADLVLWSETAIPTELNKSVMISDELISYAMDSNNEMIVGAFYKGNSGKVYNGAYYINENGISSKIYLKRKLVPFGEYLPLRNIISIIPFVDDINLYFTDLYKGVYPEVFATKNGKIGTLICFDSVFQNLCRDSVNNGAELIVVITNDSWYKDFPAVYQHNAQSIWRAVENRRWVVRCANSGISSFISPKGEVVSSLPPLVQGNISCTVDFISQKTFYTRFGDIIIIPILLSCLFILFYKKIMLFLFRNKHY